MMTAETPSSGVGKLKAAIGFPLQARVRRCGPARHCRSMAPALPGALAMAVLKTS